MKIGHAARVFVASAGIAAMALVGPSTAFGGEPKPPEPVLAAGIVVKVDLATGHSIGELAGLFPVAVVNPVLASRGIYLLRSTDPKLQEAKKLKSLVDKLRKSRAVVYAEVDAQIAVSDTQFHSWPFGPPESAPEEAWSEQPIVASMDLDAAHRLSRGAGQLIAVLDTGVDAAQPVLAGHVDRGWDYVDDDANPADVTDGSDSNGDGVADSAAGHGTFVSGLVRLVAPDARILSQRVLDSDGNGSVFTVAQAIGDSVSSGATVINLSFGTVGTFKSKLLDDAIKRAQSAGVVVVVAAGNQGSDKPHYPASRPDVLSVAALGAQDTVLASYSNCGGWVQVAAPGSDLVGPVPGGGYATWSGTSMASPLAAGQAALLFAGGGQLTAQQVVKAVEDSARPVHGMKVRHGVVDIVQSLERAARG